ncbi:clumping factor B [Drosophila sulfurigaster albostrigata]|uniref:clumping factor B n=1 Tax=Drosophila sulfurigaster albostrigata TaxID=89887 RepID=UPI002D21DFC6|nr:clumping factor B [Drosophila sulfurigaster albostrigata]
MPKVQLLMTLLLLAFTNADVSDPQDSNTPLLEPQTYAPDPSEETTKSSTAVSSSSEPADTAATTVAAGDEEPKQDADATPNQDNNQDVDGTPDADIKPDSDTKPDVDGTPDADKKPDTDTKPDADSDVDAEDPAEEGIALGNATATTIEQLESSTTTPIEDTHHEHHQHTIGHVHAHDGFHDIKREKLWAHWNDAFTTTVGIEPDNSTMQ